MNQLWLKVQIFWNAKLPAFKFSSRATSQWCLSVESHIFIEKKKTKTCRHSSQAIISLSKWNYVVKTGCYINGSLWTELIFLINTWALCHKIQTDHLQETFVFLSLSCVLKNYSQTLNQPTQARSPSPFYFLLICNSLFCSHFHFIPLLIVLVVSYHTWLDFCIHVSHWIFSSK